MNPDVCQCVCMYDGLFTHTLSLLTLTRGASRILWKLLLLFAPTRFSLGSEVKGWICVMTAGSVLLQHLASALCEPALKWQEKQKEKLTLTHLKQLVDHLTAMCLYLFHVYFFICNKYNISYCSWVCLYLQYNPCFILQYWNLDFVADANICRLKHLLIIIYYQIFFNTYTHKFNQWRF